MLTTFLTDIRSVAAEAGVYAPQEDSHLLIEAMQTMDMTGNRSVADLCTGSGVVAIAAAQLGARAVTAFDVCRRAVDCARRNAAEAGVQVDVRHGTYSDAVHLGPFDVVVANPPYVPAPPRIDERSAPAEAGDGPSRAWDAGIDGRMVLDPLCRTASLLLSLGGTMMIVQSEFANPQKSVRMLRSNGLEADVVLSRTIPFGPVLTGRATWMERTGLLTPGRRDEKIVVVRAEKP